MRRGLRFFLEIVPALVVFSAALWLGVVHHVEPFHTYLYLFSWLPFLWVLDRGHVLKKGRSFFSAMSGRAAGWNLLWLGVLSTTVWLLFEAINFRLANWSYLGSPRPLPIRWAGYAVSYATVFPGVLILASLLAPRSLANRPGNSGPGRARRTARWALPLGLAMTALPLAFPRLFFPLVWVAAFFLLEPYVQAGGGHSILADWEAGRWRPTSALLVAGLLCGLFWEACNFGAGAKWVYSIPYLGFFKIFEMPVLGYLGFPAFALEVFVFYEAARAFWRERTPGARAALGVLVVLFWGAVFAGVDAFTVVAFR